MINMSERGILISHSGTSMAYSAGDNINITNRVISGKDWSEDIASAVSSKMDSSAFTGSYVPLSATSCTIGSGNSAGDDTLVQGITNSGGNKSFVQGASNTAGSNSMAQGVFCNATYTSFAQGEANTASGVSFAQGKNCEAYDYSVAMGDVTSASYTSFAFGQASTADYNSYAFGGSNTYASGGSLAIGNDNYLVNSGFGIGHHLSGSNGVYLGHYNEHTAVPFAFGIGTSAERKDAMIINNQGAVSARRVIVSSIDVGYQLANKQFHTLPYECASSTYIGPTSSYDDQYPEQDLPYTMMLLNLSSSTGSLVYWYAGGSTASLSPGQWAMLCNDGMGGIYSLMTGNSIYQ